MKKILYSITLILTNLILIISCKKEDLGIKYGKGVTDIIGNNYKTVIIGKQEWMAENLRTTKYNDGGTIPNVTNDDQWSQYNIEGAWCYYDNDIKNDSLFGKLYNWDAVNTCKLCPTGWHVPTEIEWEDLSDYLESNGYIRNDGSAIKSISGWYRNGNGTDNYGWNGLPGGFRNGLGGFDKIEKSGNWWSSSININKNPYICNLVYNSSYLFVRVGYKAGYSVRCIRN